jgi:hypothetical protein
MSYTNNKQAVCFVLGVCSLCTSCVDVPVSLIKVFYYISFLEKNLERRIVLPSKIGTVCREDFFFKRLQSIGKSLDSKNTWIYIAVSNPESLDQKLVFLSLDQTLE